MAIHYPGRAQVVTATAGDDTPSVAGATVLITANVGATVITMLDGGYTGQEVVVIVADAQTTVDFSGTHMLGNAGADWSPTLGSHMCCVFDGTDWHCAVSNNTA